MTRPARMYAGGIPRERDTHHGTGGVYPPWYTLHIHQGMPPSCHIHQGMPPSCPYTSGCVYPPWYTSQGVYTHRGIPLRVYNRHPVHTSGCITVTPYIPQGVYTHRYTSQGVYTHRYTSQGVHTPYIPQDVHTPYIPQGVYSPGYTYGCYTGSTYPRVLHGWYIPRVYLRERDTVAQTVLHSLEEWWILLRRLFSTLWEIRLDMRRREACSSP